MPCVVSVNTNATNVVDNHRLFSGRIPHPQLFGISGYVAATTIGAGAGEGLKIFPDLANAEGTGSHVDWTWKLHGIPSYLYTEHNLSSAVLERNSYRIVQNTAPNSDMDAQPSYAVILTSASTVTLDKRTDCLVRDTPPTPVNSAVRCSFRHAATLEDCQYLFYQMRDDMCIPFDGSGRVIQTFRSCGIVAQANGSILNCAKPRDMARLALPIIDQCWRRYGDGPCTNWASGVTDSSAYIPKTCVCNNNSVRAC
ncbi:Multispanning membrane protein [Pseudozyma hubeiensis]|nr:Multispanning membrane protein [Pseudozyma hubeiensis]